jgi:fermentation-respiration switch protein FrsA (DUF1100 family)
MKKSAKALLGASAAFVGAGAIMNVVVQTRFSKIVSDKRGELESKNNPADPTEPVNILRAEGDAWVDSKDYDHICIKNRKKQPIHALIVKADAPSDKWLVCIHGYTSSPKGMGSYAKHYHDRGFNILLPALRGHDVSEHKYISMGWLDRLDIVDWIGYLNDVYKDIQIVIHGVSMGAATTMNTTGEELPANVKCAIADCGFTTMWDELKSELKASYHLHAFPTLCSSSIISKVIAGHTYKEASCLKQLKKSKTPTLFIHGEEDDLVPYDMMDRNYNEAACPKEKLSIPDAKHADSHLVHPEIYWPKVFEFVDKYVH